MVCYKMACSLSVYSHARPPREIRVLHERFQQKYDTKSGDFGVIGDFGASESLKKAINVASHIVVFSWNQTFNL